MKTNIFNRGKIQALTLILALGMITLASCHKDQPPVEPVNRNCTANGKFVRVMCGASIYDNLWIKLDNGKLLQPCATDVVFICKPDMQEGQRVKVGYVPQGRPNSCDQMIICQAVPPPHQTVRITCLELGEVPDPDCGLQGTVRDYRAYAGPLPCGWLIEADNGVKVQPHDLPQGFELRDGMRVSFSYNQVETFQAICFGAVGGQITCIKEIGNTQPDCKPMTNASNNKTMNPGGISAVGIQDAYIENGCLKIKAGFSGCNDDISRFDLEWNGYVSKTNPSQTTVRVVDNAPQACEAYFIKTLSFDLSKLNAYRPLVINIEGWNTGIWY